MPTSYPTSLDSYTTKVDSVSDVLAADVNNLQDAMAAIQTRVGTSASPTFLPRAGGSMTGTLSTTFGINLTRDSVAADPYAPLSVTRGTASNFAYASFVRSGTVAWQVGINTSNALIIGSGTSGIDGVISTARLTLDTSSNLTAAGNVTAYSDERLKTNWRDLDTNFLTRLADVKVGVYERTDTGSTQVGVSAQSLREVLPQAVQEDADGMLSVAYGNAALTACVMLARRVRELEAKLES